MEQNQQNEIQVNKSLVAVQEFWDSWAVIEDLVMAAALATEAFLVAVILVIVAMEIEDSASSVEDHQFSQAITMAQLSSEQIWTPQTLIRPISTPATTILSKIDVSGLHSKDDEVEVEAASEEAAVPTMMFPTKAMSNLCKSD